MKDDYDPVQVEKMTSLGSLILQDTEGWSGETDSEGEERTASDNQHEENLACDDKC